MMGKQFILPLLVAGMVGAAATAAVADTDKHAKDWTCADFLAIDKQYQPKVVYWATAYSKRDKPEGGILDIEATEKVTPMIVAACAASPKESFWDKFKDEWHKVGSDTKHEMEKMKERM